jgi:hypothetical protein
MKREKINPLQIDLDFPTDTGPSEQKKIEISKNDPSKTKTEEIKNLDNTEKDEDNEEGDYKYSWQRIHNK